MAGNEQQESCAYIARHAGAVSERLCLGCRAVRPKSELVRIVRGADGALHCDRTGKLPGHGAYVCPNPDCVALAFKRHGFERAYKSQMSPALLETLRRDLDDFINGL